MKTLTSMLVTAISVLSLSLVLSGCADKADYQGYSPPEYNKTGVGGYSDHAVVPGSANSSRGMEQMDNFRNPAARQTNPDRGSQSNK